MVTDLRSASSTVGLHTCATADPSVYYSVGAIGKRRVYSGAMLIALILISTALDRLVYPLAHYPGDMAKHAVESLMLPLLSGDPVRNLVANGKIRPATTSDIVAWERASTRNSYSGRLASHRSEHLREVDAYVVLTHIRMPGGMYGARSHIFIVPEGVSKPRDLGSHNSYFIVEDSSISGVSADE